MKWGEQKRQTLYQREKKMMSEGERIDVREMMARMTDGEGGHRRKGQRKKEGCAGEKNGKQKGGRRGMQKV